MDHIIRKMTRMAYAVQELRIATGLRVVAQFTERFSDARVPNDTEDQDAIDRERDKLLKRIIESYTRVTDGIVAGARNKLYKFDNILTNETELWFVESYMDILKQEEAAFKRLGKALDRFPFYAEYLSKIRGVGAAMAGVIVSELDPCRAKYPSSFWRYAGLDVVTVEDKETHQTRQEGRSRREQHLVQIEYTDRNGETKTRRGLSYNPWLKSKLLAVLAPSFLRAKNAHYTKVYQDYKNRMMQRPELQDNKAIKAIAHKRALRYMIKIFLIDLHMSWRAHEKLEVTVPYHEAKLGLTHGRDPSAEAAQQAKIAEPIEQMPVAVEPPKKRGRKKTETSVVAAAPVAEEVSAKKKTRTRRGDALDAAFREVAKDAEHVPKRNRPKGML